MEIIEHTALVALQVLSNQSLDVLRELIKTLASDAEITRISSVYKVGEPHTDPAHGFFSLSVVLKVQTVKPRREFAASLQALEREWTEGLTRRATVLQIYLLTFDNDIEMTPELALPYPDLHRRSELLIPAAEIWGEYVHPVLGKSLFTLTQAIDSRHWGEFYAQGKSVLDF